MAELCCACGAVVLGVTGRGNRVVCHCDDCQAYARWLGRDDVVDASGGTDIAQVTPAQVRVVQGAERLYVVRLSTRGLVRWYAGCCRSPVGNTLAWAKPSFVGLPLRGQGAGLALSAPVATQTRFARRPVPEPLLPVIGAIGRAVAVLAAGRWSGAASPFPERTPGRETVLTPAERAALG